MVSASESPVLWIDISTVRAWRGTPHGIARVEAGLANALAELDSNARAVWAHDNRIVVGDHDALLALSDGRGSTVPGFDTAAALPSWVDGPLRSQIARLGLYGRRARASWGLSVAATALPEPVGPLVVRASSRTGARSTRTRGPADSAWIDRIGPGDLLLITGADWAAGVLAAASAAAPARRPRVWVLIHDLLPVTHPELLCNDALTTRFSEWLASVAGLAERVLFVSESSRQAFHDHLADRGHPAPPTSVLSPAVSIGSPGGESPGSPQLPNGPYVVCVGTIERRKNHVVLVQAVRSALRRGEEIPHVLFIGSWGWGTDDLRQELERDREVADRLHVLSGLPDGEMTAVVQHAEAVVFPSRFEGYGLPAAEARALGRPVIASDLPSLREILGGEAWFLDPDDAGQWRDALVAVAKGSTPPAIRHSNPRTWSQAAQEILDLISSSAPHSGRPDHGGGSPLAPRT